MSISAKSRPLPLLPLLVLTSVVCAALFPSAALADRTISEAALLDKLRGMWFGQLIGNHSGRSSEGMYRTREAGPDSAFAWVIKTSYQDPWTGDDDTNFEYLYLHCLEVYGLNPSYAQIQSEWNAHVTLDGIYIANLQAKFLMNHGFLAPGHRVLPLEHERLRH